MPLDINKAYKLYLDKEKRLHCTVRLFDANHIFGSMMFLFEGYFGRYLHTGDMRFHEYMWKEYTKLFPPELPRTPEGLPRSIQIDELILDNTYCDPVFNFPQRELCVKMVMDLIDANIPCDVHLSSYTTGKEELFIEIAKKYNTKIYATKDRYDDLTLLGFGEHFTLDENEAFIFLNRLNLEDEEAKEAYLLKRRKKYVLIQPTGWCNTQAPILQKAHEWIVPYSSHSNFTELEKLVCSVRPAVLRCIVGFHKEGLTGSIGDIKYYHQYSYVLRNIKQRGPPLFNEKYVSLSKASENYKQTRLIETRRKLNEILCLKMSEEDLLASDAQPFEKEAASTSRGIEEEEGDRKVNEEKQKPATTTAAAPGISTSSNPPHKPKVSKHAQKNKRKSDENNNAKLGGGKRIDEKKLLNFFGVVSGVAKGEKS